MSSSQQISFQNKKFLGRFDLIHIVLAVLALIFLILSIIFIILFATKHESSTGFLTTGFSTSTKNEISQDFQSKLSSQYKINSFALDLSNNQVSAVFSLRGSISNDDVQNLLSKSNLVTQVETTYGDKASSVCHRQQLLTSTINYSKSTSPTVPNIQTTTTTGKPVPNTKYCNSNVQRNIFLVIDIGNLPGVTDNQEKINSLKILQKKALNGFNLPTTKVQLISVNNKNVSSISNSFRSTQQELSSDFDKLLQIQPEISDSFDYTSLTFLINSIINEMTTDEASFQLIIITEKGNGANGKEIDLVKTGIYTVVSSIGKNRETNYKKIVTEVLPYDNWNDLTMDDPISKVACKFYKKPTSNIEMQIQENFKRNNFDAISNSSQCEMVDIYIAFDTSQSLSSLILENYKEFAWNFVQKYKISGTDYSRIGILSFNDDVTTVLLVENSISIQNVASSIDKIRYTAGLTDITKSLQKASELFQISSVSRNKALIVLSDGIPTVDTVQSLIEAGHNLTKQGVQTFFVGYSQYSNDSKNMLSQVTGNPNHVLENTTNSTNNQLTSQILLSYPCPIPKCVTGYYAVEVSEATSQFTIQNLKTILKLSTIARKNQNGNEFYQLITYNENNTIFHLNDTDQSFESFQSCVSRLIDTGVGHLIHGTTRLDLAIITITQHLQKILRRNLRASSNIIFFGEASEKVLNTNITEKHDALNDLINATKGLKEVTNNLIYVIDDSQDSTFFGNDLWEYVTSSNRIVRTSDSADQQFLDQTDYLENWSKLSCSLPALQNCFNSQLDIAIVLDLNQIPPNPKFMNYLNTFISEFTYLYDAHFGFYAYGMRDARILSNLGGHTKDEISQAFNEYYLWSNGSYFLTTQAPTSTISSKLFDETEKNESDNLELISSSTIRRVFTLLGTQFGNFSDEGDRLFAPNIYLFASDNFKSYDYSIWDEFETELNNFKCQNCQGSPSLLFLERNDNTTIKISLGNSYQIEDSDLNIDENDDETLRSSIILFNSIVNSVCSTSLPNC